MLVIPVLRLVMLLLLMAVLVDGATEQDYYNHWNFLLWDEKPDLPSGFFDLLRVVLSVCLAWDAWIHTRYARLGFSGSKGWTVVLILLLVLYQPIFPVQFAYHWWLWIDLVSISVLTVHTVIVSRPLFELMSGMVLRGENPLTAPQHIAANAIFLGYANAASLMASPAEYLSESANGPDQGNPSAKRPGTSNSGDEIRPPRRPLVQPSDPPGPIVEPHPLGEQIADTQKLINNLKDALDNPSLNPDKRVAAERALRGARQLLDNRKARHQDVFEQKGLREAKPTRARHSERSTVDLTEMDIGTLKVKRTQLVEALKRTTKMKRAPPGARSSRLKEGALVPELVGFRVEMAGGSSLVDLEEGRLEREVVFVAAKMEPVLKVLSTYDGVDDFVKISIGETAIVFRCGSSKLTIPRTK